jgi:hypothetical protein
MRKYSLELRFAGDGGAYRIMMGEKVAFSRPHVEDEDLGEYFWPADVRAEYQRLTGKSEFVETGERPFNVVPAIFADDDEVVYDCPCVWAQRVKDHAVYCENSGWLYSPRKCRRGPGSWDGTPPQETCPGFKKNDLQNSETLKAGAVGDGDVRSRNPQGRPGQL